MNNEVELTECDRAVWSAPVRHVLNIDAAEGGTNADFGENGSCYPSIS